MTALESAILAYIRAHPGATYGQICAALPSYEGTQIISAVVALKHGYKVIEGHADGYKPVTGEVTE